MKVSVPSIVLPFAGAAASGFLVSMVTWDGLRTALLPAISIIAAAVLVRLARGLPFTNADHFTLEQFRSVSRNLESNARKLRALIFVCLIVLAVLIFGGDLVHLVAVTTGRWPWVGTAADHIVSSAIGGLLTYAFTRVVEVVHSDVSLLRLQSKVLETAIATKNAKTFEKANADEVRPGIAGADRFGKRLPH